MKKCICPYSLSCHEIRQDQQSKLRIKRKTNIEQCIFYNYLKPLYEIQNKESE